MSGEAADVVAQRLAAQLLVGPPAAEPAAVVERLLAVQAQDPRGARLAVRARTSGLRAADVDRALTADRSLVTTWLNRGTLHLVRSADYWWLQALTAPSLFTANARRLAQEGVPAAAAERVVAAGVPVAGQALVHVLFLASLRGIAVRGPMLGREHAFVLVRDWLGAPPAAVDRDRALAELARRYLAGHGPATDRDLAKWAGLPLGDARRGLRAIAGQLDQRFDGLVDLTGRPRPTALPGPRLLGAFDPLLLGWTSREPIVGTHQELVTVNGVFRPFVLVGGQAVGTWSMTGTKVTLTPFGAFEPAVVAALVTDAADVVRFLTAGIESA